MRSFYRWTVAASLLLAPVAANAQVVFNNGTPDNLNGWNLFSGIRTANDFTLASTTSLAGLNWWVIAVGATGASSRLAATVQR